MNEADMIQVGYLFAKGFMKYIAFLFIIGMAIILSLNFLRWCFQVGVDDSDLSSWKRSDMKVYTDYKTGVQYVGTHNGLSLRVDENGLPVTINIK